MNDIKTAKRNKLDKPLFALMLPAMYGKTHNFDFAKLGVIMASTWGYNDSKNLAILFENLDIILNLHHFVLKKSDPETLTISVNKS